MMLSGILYTGFLFVTYGMALEGADLQARTSAFTMFVLGIAVAWAGVDVYLPSRDRESTLLAKRRAYVTKLITKKVTDVMQNTERLSRSMDSETDTDEDPTSETLHIIKMGSFSEVPGLHTPRPESQRR